MFGFIRPVKSELRVREAERFNQVYCGLCRLIKADYGGFYTLFLSYDMVFLALVMGCGTEAGDTPQPCKRRCAVRPLRGKTCAVADEALVLAARIGVLLAYHKFEDSVKDECGAKRLLSRMLCALGRKSYRKARDKLPETDAEMARALSELQRLENENCDSMDRAADASARLVAAVAGQGGEPRERVLRQMFYQIGRWLYILDAAQDVGEDMAQGRYNPVARRYGLEEADITPVKKSLELTLERSLADVCMAFDLLDVRRDEGIIRNIIFLGMPVVTRQVLDGTYQMRGGWGKHGSL